MMSLTLLFSEADVTTEFQMVAAATGLLMLTT